ncbi:MAG: aspartate 1-decarboxylase [Deltaproteobacteria bacterium]|nr:aspartate 1-decarboxylase [Deltaproteobacteria bacterium]
MQRIMLKSKIHRATLTDANLNYEGSITIDEDLMEAADILAFEQVHIYDINNGNRFETYVIKGERGSGTICVNGAAARLVARDDLIIIASYFNLDGAEAKEHKPKLIYVDENNDIIGEKRNLVALSNN